MLYKVVATAGKFDPLYPRDLNFLRYARDLGDELVIILYNDYRIVKSNTVLSIVGVKETGRINRLEELDFVDVVVLSQHGNDFRYKPFTEYERETDLSIGYELEQLMPHLFITNSMETFDLNKIQCKELCIETKFIEMGEYEYYDSKEEVNG
jgi:hypothetical protein